MNIATNRKTFSLGDPVTPSRLIEDKLAKLYQKDRRWPALDKFYEEGMPTRTHEAWRHSDLKKAIDGIRLSEAREPQPTLRVADRSARLSFRAGQFVEPSSVPDGLWIYREESATGNQASLYSPLAAATSVISDAANSENSLVIEISAPISGPLELLIDSTERFLDFNRVILRIADGVELVLVENYLGGSVLSSFVIDIELGKGSQVSRTILQSGTIDDVQVISSFVALQKEAHYTQTAMLFGGRLSRLETHVRHSGAHSKAELNSAYLTAPGFHTDVTTHVEHGAPSCVTRQLTKGAVAAGGIAVHQGKFLVPRVHGQQSDASMEHRGLMLSQGAEIFSKPELEIYADDVECAHGNTSSLIDKNLVFYLQQRGIPEWEAKKILTKAFIMEPLASLTEELIGQVDCFVDEFLERNILEKGELG